MFSCEGKFLSGKYGIRQANFRQISHSLLGACRIHSTAHPPGRRREQLSTPASAGDHFSTGQRFGVVPSPPLSCFSHLPTGAGSRVVPVGSQQAGKFRANFDPAYKVNDMVNDQQVNFFKNFARCARRQIINQICENPYRSQRRRGRPGERKAALCSTHIK